VCIFTGCLFTVQLCQTELHLLHDRESALKEKETLLKEAQSSLDRLVAVEVQSKLAEKQQVTFLSF